MRTAPVIERTADTKQNSDSSVRAKRRAGSLPKLRGLAVLARSWRDLLIVAALTVTSSILFLLCFQGIDGADGVLYANAAERFLNNGGHSAHRTGTPIFDVRLGLIAPTSLMIKLFGHQELPLLIYPFVFSVATVVLAYFIGRTFFGRLGGLLAALGYGAIPIVLLQGTKLGSEIPACFWANLGIFLTYLAGKRHVRTHASPKRKRRNQLREFGGPATGRIANPSPQHRRKQFRTDWQSVLFAAFAGLSFGVSWMHKVSVVYLVPFVAVYMLYQMKQHRSAWRVGTVIAGVALCVVLLEGVFHYRVNDDFLYRMHATQRNFEVNAKYHYFFEGSPHGWEPGSYWPALLKRLFVEGPKRILNANVLIKVAVLALALALLVRDRRFAFVGTWFVALALMYNFFTTDFSVYRPLVLEPRYLTPLFLPASVLAAGVLVRLFRRVGTVSATAVRERFLFGTTVAVAIVLSTIPGWQFVFASGPTYKSVRQAVARIPAGAPVATDSKTALGLKWLGYADSLQVTSFDRNDVGALRDTYVLINQRRLEKNHRNYGRALPSFTNKLPSEWRQVSKHPGVVLAYTRPQQ